VLHSPWWLRAHWGRAFEIERIDEAPHPGWHGFIVLRRRDDDAVPTVEALEALEPDEPRELGALRHHVRQLEREAAGLAAEKAHAEQLARQAAAAVPPPRPVVEHEVSVREGAGAVARAALRAGRRVAARGRRAAGGGVRRLRARAPH
jgi:hypothetical protein